MKTKAAIQTLSEWDRKGRCVHTLHDLAKLFPDDSRKTLQEGVNRLVRAGLLERVCRGVYVYALACGRDRHLIERIARTLRRGRYNYISLESALSEHGAISQIPVDRLTVMTTGCKGEYRTPYGVIEFTHTKRGVCDILAGMKNVQRPLQMATPQTAWRDLKRVGRNTHLVDESALPRD